jgi:S-adenosylmethionine hydrolase
VSRTIALLTDFGLRDVYVGVMKGVLATMAPEASVIDLTHEVDPGQVRVAAFRLWQALRYMPPGTVFLAVVDPGVGSFRRPMAASWKGFLFVGPDNGLFSYVLPDASDVRAVELDPSRLRGFPAAATFHGRDIFAPAAARLAEGAHLEDLGSLLSSHAPLVRLPHPRLTADPRAGLIRGEVVCTDRFGNAVTSIGILRPRGSQIELEPWAPGAMAMSLDTAGLQVTLSSSTSLRLQRTFADAPQGTPVAYVGSDGLLEIGVNGGSAAAVLGLAAGAEIVLGRS